MSQLSDYIEALQSLIERRFSIDSVREASSSGPPARPPDQEKEVSGECEFRELSQSCCESNALVSGWRGCF